MKNDTIQTRKWITRCLMALLTFCLVLTGVFFIAPIEVEAEELPPTIQFFPTSLGSGTFEMENDYTISDVPDGSIRITIPSGQNVTINGNGHTITVEAAFKSMEIENHQDSLLFMVESSATLTLNNVNIRLDDTQGRWGGHQEFIWMGLFSKVTLNNCTVDGAAHINKTGEELDGRSIYVSPTATLTLNNVEYSADRIYNAGLLNVNDCEFIHYNFKPGAAIYQAGETSYSEGFTTYTYQPRMYIAGTTTFKKLTAIQGEWDMMDDIDGDGGAIYIEEGGLEAYIGNSDDSVITFEECRANRGGAIYAEATVNGTHIYGNVVFKNNSAKTVGGAIYGSNIWIGRQGTSRVSITDNTAGTYGGGIAAVDKVYLGKVDVTNNTAGSSTSTTSGGGVYAEGLFAVTSTTNISNNKSVGYGGGIYVTSTGTLQIEYLPYVDGNTNTNNEASDIYLSHNSSTGSSAKIKVINGLYKTADSGTMAVPIGLRVGSSRTTFTTGWANANQEIPDVFVSEVSGKALYEDASGELYMDAGYLVTIDPNDGATAGASVYMETVTWADTAAYRPTRKGYTFKGWTTTKDDASTLVLSKSVTSYTPTSAVTLYGLWEINTYDITYSLNGGSVDGWTPTPFTATYGESYMLVPSTTPTRSGYTFTGWTITYVYRSVKNTIDLTEQYIGATIPFDMAYGDLTIKANWTERTATSISLPLKLQTQRYVVGEELKSFNITVTYDNGETEKVAVTDAMVTNFSTESVAVLWVTATVAYEGLTTTFRYTVSVGYAYKVEHYQENIDDDGYTLVSADTENLAGVGTTNAVAKTYTGFTAQSFEQQAIAEDGSTVVKIYYKRNIYTLTYDLDGGTIEGQTEFTAKYGQTISPNNATPTKQGFRFVEYVFLVNTNNGWEVLGTAKANDDVWFGYAHNLKLQASWEERQIESISIPAVSQNQSYVVGGAFVPFNITVTYDNGETESVEVTEAMLTDFSTTSAVDSATATVTYTEGEVTKTATFTYSVTNGYAYTVKHYQENLDDDGYTLKDTQTLYGVGTTNAAALTYEGFTAKSFSQVAVNTDGSTVVEIYYDRNTYTIEVNLNGGTLSGANDITVKFGETYRLPSGTPTKAGYTFGGWKIYIDGEVYINASVGNSWLSVGIPMDKAPDDTIEAIVTWNEREISDMQLNVTNTTYEVGDEFRPFNMTVVYDNGETKTVQVTAEMLTDFSTATVTNLTAAYVHYEGASKIMTYTVVEKTNTVSFNIGGGTGTAPQSMDATVGASITLPSADGLTKTGYTFGGWSDGTNTYEAGASYTPSEDISLTAVWKLKAPTITIEGVEPLEGDNKADYVLAFTYDGNAHNITLNGSHELGNAVTYEYYMIKYTANSANPDMDSLPPWALITDTTQSFTNVSDSNYYLCVVKTTLDDETTAAYTIIKVDISKADQTITLSENEFIYSEGLTIDFADYVSGTGDGTLSYAASAQNGVTFDFANGVVSNITKAGSTFTLTVTKAATDNYNSATQTFTVTLNKGTQTLSVSGSPNPPTWKQEYQVSVSGNKGALSYAIISGNATVNESGVITATGTGQIRYSVTAAATNLYEAVTVERTVTFGKAAGNLAPDYATSKPTNLTICVGHTTDDIMLPTGWSFVSTTALETIGRTSVSAVYTPSDTANYNSYTEDIAIAVFDHTGGTAASCTTDHICTECGEVLVEALGHNYNEQVDNTVRTTAANCQECNTYWYDCSRCGASAKNDVNATDKWYTSNEAGEHNMSSDWTSENGQHFHKCTVNGCTHTDTKVNCTGGMATCVSPAICSVCQNPYGSVTAHHFYDTSEWGYKGTDGHAHVCEYCGVHDTVVGHTPNVDAATEETAKYCTVCDFVIEQQLNHVHSEGTVWKYDFEYHWHDCVGNDGQVYSKAEHTYDNACDTTCNVCNATRTITHDYSKLEKNDTEHWYVCSVCGSEKANSRVNHSGGTSDCQHKAECATCGQTYGEFGNHDYDTTVWVSVDDLNHAHKCRLCDAYTNMTIHQSEDEATCIEDKLCDACGHKMEDAHGHSYTQQIESPAYLKAEGADCQSHHTYYYVCEHCDASSKDDTDTFFEGVAVGAHKMSAAWTTEYAEETNAGWHYHACTVDDCDYREDEGDCHGGERTCIALAICSTCQKAYGEYAEHSFGNTWEYKDATGHAHVCTVKGCNEHDEIKAHTPNIPAATEESAQYCTACEYQMAAQLNHTHSHSTEWTSNATHHWKACGGCEEHLEEAPHNYDPNNACDTTCEVCNAVREVSHDFTGEWEKDASGHWHVCTKNGCSVTDTKQNHVSAGAATENDPEVCSICGWQIAPALGHTTHTPEAEWQKNETHHWHECTGCDDQELDKAAHVDDNGDNKCDTCDYTMPAHDSNSQSPVDNPPTDYNDGLGTGAIIGIVVAAVAVVGGGVFAIFWFVIRKRRR